MEENELQIHNSKLIIFNIIIAFIAAICLLTSVTGSFWNFRIGFTVTREFLESTVESAMSEETSGYLEDVDWDEIAGQSIGISVSLDSQMLLPLVFKTADDTVNLMLDQQVDSLVAQIKPIFSSLMRMSIKTVMAVTLSQIFAEQGIEGDIDLSSIDTIVDDFLDNTASREETVNSLTLLLSSQLEALAGEEIPAEVETMISDSINSFIEPTDAYRDTDGNLDIVQLMIGILQTTGTIPEGEPKTTEECIAELKTMLVENMESSGTTQYISIALKVVGVINMIVALAWGLLLIMSIIHIFLKNKAVSMAFPRIVGWMPYVFFVGIPNLVVMFAPMVIGEFTGFDLSGLSIYFSGLSIISAIGSVVLAFISWIFYRRTKRKAKAARVLEERRNAWSN